MPFVGKKKEFVVLATGRQSSQFVHVKFSLVSSFPVGTFFKCHLLSICPLWLSCADGSLPLWRKWCSLFHLFPPALPSSICWLPPVSYKPCSPITIGFVTCSSPLDRKIAILVVTDWFSKFAISVSSRTVRDYVFVLNHHGPGVKWSTEPRLITPRVSSDMKPPAKSQTKGGTIRS